MASRSEGRMVLWSIAALAVVGACASGAVDVEGQQHPANPEAITSPLPQSPRAFDSTYDPSEGIAAPAGAGHHHHHAAGPSPSASAPPPGSDDELEGEGGGS
jgi:hypothetical protein